MRTSNHPALRLQGHVPKEQSWLCTALHNSACKGVRSAQLCTVLRSSATVAGTIRVPPPATSSRSTAAGCTFVHAGNSSPTPTHRGTVNTAHRTPFVEHQSDRISPTTPLTEAQQRWIGAYLQVANGRRFFSPTLDEIAEAASICKSRAYQIGNELVEKGYVVRHVGGSRNLELVRRQDGTEVPRWFA